MGKVKLIVSNGVTYAAPVGGSLAQKAYSPTITLEETDEGVVITTVDVNGEQTATVYNGNIQEAMESVAPTFDSTADYSEGDYVVYEDKMYIAAEDVSAGEWNAEQWTEVTVAEELQRIEDEIAVVPGTGVGSAKTRDFVNNEKVCTNIASGIASFAEGSNTTASGNYSHTEGLSNTASGNMSHAEGGLTIASNVCSHAEGRETVASGLYSHAEGVGTNATGKNSHAEGWSTVASGFSSHTEGVSSKASGYATHAEGMETIASGMYQHVQGKWNIEDSDSVYADIIGNGTSDSDRSNAATVDWSGNAWYAGKVSAGTTDSPASVENDNDLTTKAYVDNAVSNINTMDMHICSSEEYDSETGIPTVESPNLKTFYLVPGGEGPNLYIEWAYINDAWEQFGSATIEIPVTDVQVAGTSVVTSGVGNVPAAGTDVYGAVKMGSSGQTGLKINSSGYIMISEADTSAIKTASNNHLPITPYYNHQATFYGLAKAAGDSTQKSSSNAVGTYTDEAKDAIQSMFGVTDLIGPHETAQASKAYAIGDSFVYLGKLYKATSAIAEGDAIAPGTNCEQLSLSGEIATLEQTVSGKADAVTEVTVSGTDPVIVAEENHRYICGECATLSFTPCASGLCDVVFSSGTTATILTVPGTVKWPSSFNAASLGTETIYELNVLNGVYGAVGTWT